jgi:hypothetical protein
MTKSWQKTALAVGMVVAVAYTGVTWLGGEYQTNAVEHEQQATAQSTEPVQPISNGFPGTDESNPVAANSPANAALGSTLGHDLARIATTDARAGLGQSDDSTALIVSAAPATGELDLNGASLAIPIDADTRNAAADTLFQATEDAVTSFSLGPITACLDQMRSFACPIAGTIPIVKDIVGRLSMELGIYCPTGTSGSKRI